MKILVITHIFPNHLEPTGGIFNKYQVRALAEYCEIKVIAPIPWFPGCGLFSKKVEFSYAGKVMAKETMDGLEVMHPLYLTIPKIGRFLQGAFYFLRILPLILKMRKRFKFDAIYSTWAYPDSFAAALISKILSKPLVAKVHGSDINELGNSFCKRMMIRFALSNAERIVTVSLDLKNKICQMGIEESKISAIYNGVNREVFRILPQSGCRRELGIGPKENIILFVGNLKKVKGLSFLIEAVSILARKGELLRLYIIGTGPLETYLKTLVEKKSLQRQIIFLGVRSPEEIAIWMNASDILTLASINEGVPNVILEALSCGRPVVATKAGGIPEIVSSRDYGILTESGDAKSLASSIDEALSRDWDREKIAERGKSFSWDKNTSELYKVIYDVSFCEKNIIKDIILHIFPKQFLINRGRPSSKKVALTFDDGPDERFTGPILDILRQYDIRATFFIVGSKAEKHPEILKRITSEGHEIGNHGYYHGDGNGFRWSSINDEINRTQSIIKDVTGKSSGLFRAPYGKLNIYYLGLALIKGLTYVLWSVDPKDYLAWNASIIMENLERFRIRGGDIILMHDRLQSTIDALPKVIQKIRHLDLEFGTVKDIQ